MLRHGFGEFCHSPETWKAMWEDVSQASPDTDNSGSVPVEVEVITRIQEVDEVTVREYWGDEPGGMCRMIWSVTIL